MQASFQKHPKIKLQRLWKVWIWTFGSLYIKSILYKWFLNWKKTFKKIVAGKTSLFVTGPLCTPRSIFLNIGFWRDSFVWKCCTFNLSAFNENRYSSFLKKVSVSQKIHFKVKVLKTFKISSACHINTCRLSNEGLFWKPLVLFFKVTYAIFVGFKMKTSKRKRFPVLRQNQLKFCPKT